ncbi:26491_t:CDS:2, partial [Gigaspora margarita]
MSEVYRQAAILVVLLEQSDFGNGPKFTLNKASILKLKRWTQDVWTELKAAEILMIFYKVKECRIRRAYLDSDRLTDDPLNYILDILGMLHPMIRHHFIIVGKKSYSSGKYNLLVPTPEEKKHFDVRVLQIENDGKLIFKGTFTLLDGENLSLGAFHSSVLIDNKLYFSGGTNQSVDGMNKFIYLDVSKPFTTTDNVSMPWIDLTYTGGPSKLYATACIGGKNNDMICIFGDYPSSINQSFINQFDTSKQQWINITSVGNVPTIGYGYSCANFNNGLMAIFNGTGSTNELWIFNTLILTWSLNNATNAPLPTLGYYTTMFQGQWSSGNISNPIVDLILFGHTATLVDNYMQKGRFADKNKSFSSRIFMLDVNRKDSYKWVTEFTPNTTTTTTVTTSSSNTSSESKNTGIIIGAIIG